MWPLSALRADRPNVSWPVALRRVQAWLHPWTLQSIERLAPIVEAAHKL